MMMKMTEILVFQLIGSWLSIYFGPKHQSRCWCLWLLVIFLLIMLMPSTFFADNADADEWSWVFRRIWHIIKFIWKVGFAICYFYFCWWVILRIWQNLGTSSHLSGKLDLQFAKTCWTTISVTATISDLQTSSFTWNVAAFCNCILSYILK